MKQLISLLLTLLFSLSAWSYIPKFNYILSRTANVHGSGVYLVDQDVTIMGAGQNPITLHEQWLIDGGIASIVFEFFILFVRSFMFFIDDN